MSSLKEYLYSHIPLTRAMEVEVDSISDTAITLSAPNINHCETVFGGSA